MAYSKRFIQYLAEKLSKTGDIQYDASIELIRLVESFVKQCKTKNAAKLKVQDLEDSIDFAYKVCALVSAYYDAQLEPGEVAWSMNLDFAHGPDKRPSPVEYDESEQGDESENESKDS